MSELSRALSKICKTCTCCGHLFTRAEWGTLLAKGTQVTEDDEFTYTLTLKDCPHCGSTIGIETRTTKEELRP